MDPTPDDDPRPPDAARLELSPEAMRALGYRAVDLVVEHLATLPRVGS